MRQTFQTRLFLNIPCCFQLPCVDVTADPLTGLPPRHEESIVHGLQTVMPPSENAFPIAFGESTPMLVQGLPAGSSDSLYRRSLLVQVSRTPRMVNLSRPHTCQPNYSTEHAKASIDSLKHHNVLIRHWRTKHYAVNLMLLSFFLLYEFSALIGREFRTK